MLWSEGAVARLIPMATVLSALVTHGSVKLLDDSRQTNQTFAVNNDLQANESPRVTEIRFGVWPWHYQT